MNANALVCYAPPPLPGLPDDTVVRDVNRIFALIREEGGEPLLPALPDAGTRVRLKSRLQHLEAAIAPAGPLNVNAIEKDPGAQAIAGMITGFTANRRRDEDSDWHEVVISYRSHLADLPVFAIQAACRDVASNKVKDLDPDWIPSSARLHEIAEGHAGPRWGEQHRIKKILAVTRTTPAPLTAEKQAELRTKFEGLASELRVKVDDDAALREQRRADEITATNEGFILREYKALGIEPVRASDGTLVSPTLAQKTGAIIVPKRRRR